MNDRASNGRPQGQFYGKLFILAIAVQSFAPSQASINESLGLKLTRFGSVYTAVNMYTMVTYGYFSIILASLMELKTLSLLGLVGIGLRPALAVFADRHESKHLKSLCLGLAEPLGFLQHMPFLVLWSHYKDRWRGRNWIALFLLVMFFAGLSGGVTSVEPELSPSISEVTSFLSAFLLLISIPKTPGAYTPLKRRDWVHFGGSIVVLAGYTIWVHELVAMEPEHHHDDFQAVLKWITVKAFIFFAFCGLVIFGSAIEINQRQESWKPRFAYLSSLLSKFDGQEINSDSSKSPV